MRARKISWMHVVLIGAIPGTQTGGVPSYAVLEQCHQMGQQQSNGYSMDQVADSCLEPLTNTAPPTCRRVSSDGALVVSGAKNLGFIQLANLQPDAAVPVQHRVLAGSQVPLTDVTSIHIDEQSKEFYFVDGSDKIYVYRSFEHGNVAPTRWLDMDTLKGATAVAADAAHGELFVLKSGLNSMDVYGRTANTHSIAPADATDVRRSFGLGSAGLSPNGAVDLAVDPARSELYVLDQPGNRVLVLSTADGHRLRTIDGASNGLVEPQALQFMAKDGVISLTNADGTVIRLQAH